MLRERNLLENNVMIIELEMNIEKYTLNILAESFLQQNGQENIILKYFGIVNGHRILQKLSHNIHI